MTLNDLSFPYGHDVIESACAENERRLAMGKGAAYQSLLAEAKSDGVHKCTKNALLSKFGQAISVRVIRHRFGWQIKVTVEESPANGELIDFSQGALGVDINADHLAVTIVDKRGNKRYSENIPCPTAVKGQSTQQRTAVIGEAVKRVVALAKQYKVGIAHERLNFDAKKAALKETTSKHHRELLSNFAYQTALTLLIRRAYRHGIKTMDGNPANTSRIGQLKYQSRKISGHQAAAWVIARRGLGIVKERIRITVPACAGDRVLNARSATVSMPSDPFKRWQKVYALFGRTTQKQVPQEVEKTANLKVSGSVLLRYDVAVRVISQ